MWEEAQSFHLLSRHACLLEPPHVHQKEAFQALYFADFMEASSCTCDQSLTLFSALLPSQEKQGGLKIPHFSSWLRLSCDQLSTRIHPRAHPESRHRVILPPLRRLQEFQESCTRNQRQRPIYALHDLTNPLLGSTQKLSQERAVPRQLQENDVLNINIHIRSLPHSYPQGIHFKTSPVDV